MTAIPFVRSDLQTLRLAHPVVRRASRVDVTVVSLLTVIATAIWLAVIPFELLSAI
jgi:hypothetical protein